MGLKVLNGGLLTTVQDCGRRGYQASGISTSGVMDQRSAVLANLLLGNDRNEAVLEATYMGPTLSFTENNVFAVTGADLRPKLNGQDLPLYQAVQASKGDVLSFAGMKNGARCYIAFAGGLDVPMVMGSKSTNLKLKIGGYKGRRLEKNDELLFAAPEKVLSDMEVRRLDPEFFPSEQELRVVMGPQDDAFTEEGLHTFFNHVYTYTNECDRMGCRLEGSVIQHRNGGDIITDGIAFGAIQIPSHGMPIIMMADHQTTGGYTKIAGVISVDLTKAAQAKPGDRVHFRKVSVEEAQNLYQKEQERFARLQCRFQKFPEDAAAAALISSAHAAAQAECYRSVGRYRATVNGIVFHVDLEEETER